MFTQLKMDGGVDEGLDVNYMTDLYSLVLSSCIPGRNRVQYSFRLAATRSKLYSIEGSRTVYSTSSSKIKQ